MMKYKYTLLVMAAFWTALSLTSCGSSGTPEKSINNVNEAEVLLTYLEAHGNYINSEAVPSNTDAASLYNSLGSNVSVLDIRDAESFGQGHIKGAINIQPDSLLNYFEQVIEPNSYDSIVFVCDIGVRSAFVAGIFRLLGYDNVYSMKYGMSAWNSRYADALWLANLSSHLEDKLVVEDNTVPDKVYMPVIQTGYTEPYQILRERVRVILADTLKKFFVGIDQVEGRLSDYFIIKYWPEAQNHLPQLPGAFRFTPRKSLHSKGLLFNIPTDKPVLLYCNSATHGSFAVAFLRILGYDAYSLRYGTNAFMYDIVQKNTPEHAFSKDFVNELPLESSSATGMQQQTEAPAVKVKGGC